MLCYKWCALRERFMKAEPIDSSWLWCHCFSDSTLSRIRHCWIWVMFSIDFDVVNKWQPCQIKQKEKLSLPCIQLSPGRLWNNNYPKHASLGLCITASVMPPACLSSSSGSWVEWLGVSAANLLSMCVCSMENDPSVHNPKQEPLM